MADRILRLPALKERIPVATSTLYAWMADGQFPKPVPLGARAVGWRESDIDAWLDAKCGKPSEPALAENDIAARLDRIRRSHRAEGVDDAA